MQRENATVAGWNALKLPQTVPFHFSPERCAMEMKRLCRLDSVPMMQLECLNNGLSFQVLKWRLGIPGGK